MALWLVRHAETEWTITGQHTGRTDVPLTARGRAQAETIATRLEARSFALVLTSPLKRAKETCRIAGYADVAVDEPDLMEWDYGELDGLTGAQIRAKYPDWNIWNGWCPGGESIEQVAARVDRVIERACRTPGDTIAFAHGHVLRVLAARWLTLPPASGRLLALDTTSIGVLGTEKDGRIIKHWNDVASFRM
jgi:broad specificity phosphatase PhoE